MNVDTDNERFEKGERVRMRMVRSEQRLASNEGRARFAWRLYLCGLCGDLIPDMQVIQHGTVHRGERA